MAVTTDLVNPTDVHYREKKPVGERLAQQALAKHNAHGVIAAGLMLFYIFVYAF